MNTLRISARAEKRLKTGHLWLYSNEIENQHTPLKSVAIGEQVAIENPQGKILAFAVMNPNALICGKILSRKKAFDRKQLKKILQNSLAMREQCFELPFYRLLYAEGIVIAHTDTRATPSIDDTPNRIGELGIGVVLRNVHVDRQVVWPN